MRAAVLGFPVAHSLSPAMHEAAYRALGLDDWTYERHECREDRFARFVAPLGPEWAGLSLTMPLKQIALTVADDVSPLAAETGAANTLVRTPRGWRAENTDVAGIVAALADVRGGRAVVLGAGGTARAALAALREIGVDTVDVLVRDPSRARDLRSAAKRLSVHPTVSGALSDRRRAGAAIGLADIVISTLPGGAADALVGVDPGATVLDVVYAPWPTPFAAAAAARGARVISGLEMLLHQGAAQVELMTGHKAPVEEMRAALDSALAERT